MEPIHRIEMALAIALAYGDVQGEHHKAWLIDQMIQALLDESDYREFIRMYEEDGKVWYTGIVP